MNIHTKRLLDYLILEEQAGSKKVDVNERHILPAEIAQPVIFRHKEQNLPDRLTSYFYYSQDSSIHYILHEWNEKRFNQAYYEVPAKSEEEIRAFINKYNELHKRITVIHGVSTTSGSLDNLSNVDTGTLKRKDIWRPNDSTEIELYTTLSNYFKADNNYTINRTHILRLYIKKIPTTSISPKLPSLDESKSQVLDKTFQNFILLLEKNELERARTYLSDLISGSVPTEQLKQLSDNIHKDKKLSLYFTGIQTGIDGTSFYIIQYKYETDHNIPPKELIKVTFDNQNKIAGVIPSKRN